MKLRKAELDYKKYYNCTTILAALSVASSTYLGILTGPEHRALFKDIRTYVVEE